MIYNHMHHLLLYIYNISVSGLIYRKTVSPDGQSAQLFLFTVIVFNPTDKAE